MTRCLQKWEREGGVPRSPEPSWRIHFADYITVGEQLPFPSRNISFYGKKTPCFRCQNSWGVGLCPWGENGDTRILLTSVTIRFILWPNLLPKKSTFCAVFHLTCVGDGCWGAPGAPLPRCSVLGAREEAGKGSSCPRRSWRRPLFPWTHRVVAKVISEGFTRLSSSQLKLSSLFSKSHPRSPKLQNYQERLCSSIYSDAVKLI